MKFLKNIFLVTILITKSAFAQKPVIGIKSGLALANAKIKSANPDMYPLTHKTSARAGALVGIYVDIPSGNKLLFRPGAEVVSKGIREDIGYPVKFTFVDFPINFLYKISNTHGHFIAGGGPSIGVPINDFYSRYSLKPEFGVNGLVGYQLAIGFSFNLNYNYGLSNASKNIEYFSRISNSYLGITVGYSF